jgi:hypothetical protein
MKQNSLKILDRIVTAQKQRQRRLTTLLRSPDKDAFDWFMFVPIQFNAALDILQTTRVIQKREVLQWTQGSKFSFSGGDRIYDTPKAYEQWAEALKHIRYSFHVRHATSVSPANGTSERNAGVVNFELLIPNKSRTSLIRKSVHETTQDEFVRLLIVGASSQLSLAFAEMLF